MLDCHVAVSADTPRHEVERCLESVREAINFSPFPVHLHVIRGVPGHIGRARKDGYGRGQQPYVTSVDDDDWVEAAAFACLRTAIRKNPAAIYTGSTTWQNGKPLPFDGRQSLRVFRRDVVDGFDFEKWPVLDSTALIHHADSFGECVRVSVRPYNYQLAPESKGRRLMRAHPDLTVYARGLGDVHV